MADSVRAVRLSRGLVLLLVAAVTLVVPSNVASANDPYWIEIRASQVSGTLVFEWDPVPESAWPAPQAGGPWTSLRYWAWATPLDAGFSGPYYYCNGETGSLGSIPPPPTEETSCRIPGLEPGKAYDLKVRGWLSNDALHTNAVGVGDIFDQGGITVCCGPPGPPTDFRILDEGKGAVTAVWSPAQDTGGAPVVEYRVEMVLDDQKCQTAETQCTFEGLGFAQEHRARITTVTAVGESVSVDSPALRLTPPPPNSARKVKARARGSDVVVRWKAPSSKVGQRVVRYTVRVEPGKKTCRTKKRRCRITGLATGRTYTFKVSTLDTLGRTTTSRASNPVTLVGTPAAQVPAPRPPAQEPEKPSVPLG